MNRALSTTSIYIAGSYKHRKEHAARLAIILRCYGIVVTSRWHDRNEVEPLLAATMDLEDIERSDAILFFAETPAIGYTGGGRHFELGYACARGLRCYVIGKPESVFHRLAEMRVYATLESWFACFAHDSGGDPDRRPRTIAKLAELTRSM